MLIDAFGIILWATTSTIFDQCISQNLILKKIITLPNADYGEKKQKRFRAFEPSSSTVVLQCDSNYCEPAVLILRFHVYLREKKSGRASSEAFSS